MQGSHMASGGRYPVLRTIGILLLIAGMLDLIAGVVAAVWWYRTHPVDTAVNLGMVMIAMMAGAFLGFLGIIALSELIKLLIDIEHNTRMAAGRATEQPVTSGVIAANGGEKHRTWMEGEETAEGALVRGH
jgi:hypothetical protein